MGFQQEQTREQHKEMIRGLYPPDARLAWHWSQEPGKNAWYLWRVWRIA